MKGWKVVDGHALLASVYAGVIALAIVDVLVVLATLAAWMFGWHWRKVRRVLIGAGVAAATLLVLSVSLSFFL